MELGLYTFGDVGPDPRTGRLPSPQERLHNLVEEIELADQVGLDWFGVGEHHRADYAVSSYVPVLAMAAGRTKSIRLSSAVTVLSSDDPVRVYQNHSTLDLLSDGRAEIMAGRGAYTESFALFGYDVADYDSLFSEKLRLLVALCREERVSWTGKHRSPIEDVLVHPRPVQHPFPLWVAIGGNPKSVVAAAQLGLPIALASIGRAPENFVPIVELYREAGAAAGHDPSVLRVSLNCHYHVGDTNEAAVEEFRDAYIAFDNRLAPEQGFPPLTPRMFEHAIKPRSWLAVGDSETVAEKILFQREVIGNDRWIGCSSQGGLPHRDVMRSIELFGTEVAPIVRRHTATPAREAVAVS